MIILTDVLIEQHQKNSNSMNVMARVKMSLKAQLDEEMDPNIGDLVTITEETDIGWYRYEKYIEIFCILFSTELFFIHNLSSVLGVPVEIALEFFLLLM